MSKKDSPLITVYTQGYNADKYIGQCMESVLHQTCGDFEYFVCDHGSSDGTLAVIESYAKKDSRVKVMHRDNSERGFYPSYIAEHGSGKYFAMLDSDDYMAPDCLEKLLAYAELHELDMTLCSVLGFFDGEDEAFPMRMVEREIVYDISENDKYFPEIYLFLRTTWAKLIRMDCLRKADFSTYRKNAETFICDDTAFTLANYAKCRRIGAITEPLLYYRQLESSVTAKYKPTMIDNNGNIFFETLKVLDEIGDESKNSLNYAVQVYLGSALDASELMEKSGLSAAERLNEMNRQRNSEALRMCRELIMSGEVYHSGLLEEWEDMMYEVSQRVF